MKGLLYDTLRTSNGKRWCHKRIASFSSFWVAVIYIFVPLVRPNFHVEVLAVTSLLAFSAAAIGLRLYEQNQNTQYDNYKDDDLNDNTRY